MHFFDLTVYYFKLKDSKFSFSWISSGLWGVSQAQLGVSRVRNAVSVWLLVALLKSFNPWGVESPAGALTSLHLLPLSL